MSVANQFEREMLDLINEERTSRGIDPLTLELRLNDASEDHSSWMETTGAFSHTGEGGSSAGDRMEDAGFVFSGNWTWGENIAYQSERGAPGISDDVRDLHTSLMNSPGHRANILNPDFDHIGIGLETGDNQGFDAVYVTQKFASTSAPVELDTGASSPPDTAPEPGNQDDAPVAEADNDQVDGSAANDAPDGRDGADTMSDDNKPNALNGNSGNDRLTGDDGSDRLNGGSGNDILFGGNGKDVFVFSEGMDIAFDFGKDDVVDLRDVDSISSFQDLMEGGHLSQFGGHTVIDDLDGNMMILLGADSGDIQSSDFLF
ncbi:CAP domain-containing protein [Tateyamaria sp. ANG-S1]|uniref:CAP domain-containing protein n=1 Tax=Tateyamaria sp. ANG-S1 TaxID=1577905 RepID=UPI00057CDBCB|nr:CAP domain-containing protein [Tateyamaria sp. ANG-S1]KIC51878.1 hypothetical protein RA29_00835 [Tateyamaria sp. ANG-S1]